MKSIGIITIQKCNNYGADLQAYALGAKLRSMGYDAENIDYLFYKNPRHQGSAMERPVLPVSIKNRIKEILLPIVTRLRGLLNQRQLVERAGRFDIWFMANVKVGREYRSVKSLYDDVPRYDVYMVGSDQVWNPRLYSNIKPYFLDFAPQDAKCVSYASSFGVKELSGPVFYRYKQWLRRFTHIGLREKEGADIVSAMALNAEVAHVLDPTLLLTADEWSRVAIKPEGEVPDKYLLLYDLIASPETVSLANRWAERNGWKVVRIGDGAYGPGEFVWLFAHAEAVVTNSFHGTAFSIINSKPFYSVIPRGMANSSRIESVLKSLGLMGRMKLAAECGDCERDDSIAYEEVGNKLENLKKDSEAFLKRAVEGDRPGISYKLPLGCYAAWSKDDAQRARSTSGGIFRMLAERTISRGGVVFGAAFDRDFSHVRHIAAETMEGLDPLMKSKYVWSDPVQAYKDAVTALKGGREVLFAGTPCQIAALKKLSVGVDDKLLTIDLVCHGTPRADMFESYMKELLDRFGGKCVSYDFRDKRLGWNFPRVNAHFTQGGGYFMILRNDPWYLGFGLNATLREGCFKCPYVSLERVADFTIADCWRVAASNPDWDDNKGTSCVLVNSDKAMDVWNEIAASGKINCGEYDLDLAQMRNKPLMQRALKPRMYDKVQKVFDETGSFSEAAKCFMSRKLVLKAWLVFWVKKLGWFYFRKRQ